jgi:two-component system phosphate regulon sensor histidine kinase PhoR
MLPLADLAETINHMAVQIQDRYQAAVQQRNEMEAVLSSMVEGVAVVDPQERVISLNAAAGRFLGIAPAAAVGKSIQEVARNTALQRFIAGALDVGRAVQDDLTLHRPLSPTSPERYLQVQSAPLRDAVGRRIGVVIVLHDVSELRRLEGVRRDFVANVSHEIKTPVTAIKGFAETLLEGPAHAPEDAERFLQIIARQADRLHAIVNDLLTLSRVEQDAKDKRIELERSRLARVLQAAVESCQIKAEARSVRVQVTCDPQLTAPMNAPLLEQAVVNLLDNAIKYSPTPAQVQVTAEQGNAEVVVSVADHGCGIGPEHLPRLFERFYRTDKARSRELGGTGLGLAIVKHIAQAHGGRVEVQSQVGKGSTFIIHLPAA